MVLGRIEQFSWNYHQKPKLLGLNKNYGEKKSPYLELCTFVLLLLLVTYCTVLDEGG